MTNPIKQLTLTPAVTALVKDVFGPSAKLLGTELKSYLKQRFDDARERRRNENLSSHISAVRASLPKPPPEDFKYERLDLFSDWVDGAQDVSDDDPVLSEMWREILRDIVGGHNITKSLIDVMRQMDSRMAAILLSYRRDRPFFVNAVYSVLGFTGAMRCSDEDVFHAKRLEAIGLLERDYTRITFLILGMGVAPIGGYFIFDHAFSLILESRAIMIWQGLKYMVLLYAVIVGCVLISRSLRRPSFRLTWTGSQLLKYAKSPKPESAAPESDATKGT